MKYCLFYIVAILVTAEAAILDDFWMVNLCKKSDINLKQLHLQIILIERT